MERPAPRRNNSLDGIRGLAAVAVLAFHVWLFSEAHSTMRRSEPWDWFFAELSLGLYLFFVLSGYLMFRPFVARVGGDGAWPGLRTYVRKRVVRIVPAYYFSLLGAVLLLYTGSDGLEPHLPPAGDLWIFLFAGQNYSSETVLTLNAATWTLAVEVAFYFVVPAIGLWIARTRGRLGYAVGLVLAMVAIGVAWNWWTLGEGAVWRLALPAMLPYFAFGLLAAVAVEWLKRRQEDGGVDAQKPAQTTAQKQAPALGGKAMGGVAMATGLLLVGIDIAIREAFIDERFTEVLRAMPAGAGFAVIIVAATSGQAAARLLGARLLVWLGAISYGVFLWQTPLILGARDRGWLPDSVWTAFVPVLLASIAAAVVSMRLVERPVERWAKRRAAAAQ